MKKELKVSRIENGTVMDHLPAGSALKIVKMLGIKTEHSLIIAMNVDSSKSGRKDIVKIEDKSLTKDETDKISLVAPSATINIIKGQKVASKRTVSPPGELKGILSCPNKTCITNAERCTTLFRRSGKKYACLFCERSFSLEDFGL